MQITVRFFAILRERAGVSETQLELPTKSDVAGAVELLSSRFPALRDDLKRVAYALNRAYVRGDATLNEGDELALIPPVSGG